MRQFKQRQFKQRQFRIRQFSKTSITPPPVVAEAHSDGRWSRRRRRQIITAMLLLEDE